MRVLVGKKYFSLPDFLLKNKVSAKVLTIWQKYLMLSGRIINQTPHDGAFLNTAFQMLTLIMQNTRFSEKSPQLKTIQDFFKILSDKPETHTEALAFLQQMLLDNTISPQWKTSLIFSLPVNFSNEEIFQLVMKNHSQLDLTRVKRDYTAKEKNATISFISFLLCDI